MKLRLLADPGFANRAFSETLDLLGVTLPDQDCRIEADNRAWSAPLEGVGTPRLASGDKLHHKFAVIDGRAVITGSFNWSPSAAFQNDETLLLIRSPCWRATSRRRSTASGAGPNWASAAGWPAAWSSAGAAAAAAVNGPLPPVGRRWRRRLRSVDA